MKRLASIFFAFTILLSSGLVQAALHVCPVQGMVLSKEDCHMHKASKNLKACCKPKVTILHHEDKDCCTDAFLFAISAKYGAVITFDVVKPMFMQLPGTINSQSFAIQIPKQDIRNSHDPPLPSNREILQTGCVLTI